MIRRNSRSVTLAQWLLRFITTKVYPTYLDRLAFSNNFKAKETLFHDTPPPFRRSCTARHCADRTAATPRSDRRSRYADIYERCRAGSVQALRRLPSLRRHRADVVTDLRRGASLGQIHPRKGRQRTDAALACRRPTWHVRQ